MKNKKLNKMKLFSFFLVVVGILILGVLGYKIYVDFFSNEKDNKEIDKLELYGYSLSSNDTQIYKKYYEDLSDVLNKKEIDYDMYAELLTKLYIIDFYTLSNKLSGMDIGSTEFIYPNIVDNFTLKAKNTLYKYVEINFDGKRTQKLPEVSDVTIENTEKSTFLYNDKEYESCIVKCSWEYVEDLEYEKESKLVIIKENNKLYIVESD